MTRSLQLLILDGFYALWPGRLPPFTLEWNATSGRQALVSPSIFIRISPRMNPTTPLVPACTWMVRRVPEPLCLIVTARAKEKLCAERQVRKPDFADTV